VIFGPIPPPRRATQAGYRDRGGALVDDVLFTYFAAPHSFTGEDTLEISCHGNPFIARKILEDLHARGCRPAEPGEFTKRAFLNGRLDLSQAEAVMDLLQARSDRALQAANAILKGALGREVDRLIALLVNILADIEAGIDFPEEDLPPENKAGLRRRLDELAGASGRLLATNRYGNLLRGGIRTLIIGETNAGKSSLMNRLVGHDRAIVSPEPGTTRDYLEEPLAFGRHSLRLVDTAGLNAAPSALERLGQEKAREQAGSADLFLWVLDSTRPLPALPDYLRSRMTPGNTVAVLNKSDLPPASPPPQPGPMPTVRVSALLGAGMEALEAAVAKLAEAARVEVGPELIAINARHSSALRLVKDCLDTARIELDRGAPAELLASSLRSALDGFGSIAGKVDNERILDSLFATFCIGK